MEKLNISQKKLRPKIRSYLQAQNRASEFIEEFKRGFCHGLTVLVLYGQYLESLQEEELITVIDCDDWKWLKCTLIKIVSWDENLTSLSAIDILDFERLIALCKYFQHCSHYQTIGQGRLDLSLEDTQNRHLLLEYNFAALLTEADCNKQIFIDENANTQGTLFAVLLRYAQRLIIVSCGHHSLGLFSYNNRISLYNSNHDSGPIFFNSTQLSSLISTIYTFYKFKPDISSPLGFRIYTFDKQLKFYPRQSILLKQIHTPLNIDPMHAYSAALLAARIGSKACLRYYLKQGLDPNFQTADRGSLLYITASKGFLPLTKMLLRKGADINLACFNDPFYTPLIHAATRGQVSTVKMMLERKPNTTAANLIKVLCAFPHDTQKHELIANLKVKKLAHIYKQPEAWHDAIKQCKKEGFIKHRRDLFKFFSVSQSQATLSLEEKQKPHPH